MIDEQAEPKELDTLIAEVTARVEAATEGPWHALSTGVSGGDHWYVTDADQSIASIHCSDGEDEDTRQPDAEFIAHAREDVPALLAALKSLRDELRVARAAEDRQATLTVNWQEDAADWQERAETAQRIYENAVEVANKEKLARVAAESALWERDAQIAAAVAHITPPSMDIRLGEIRRILTAPASPTESFAERMARQSVEVHEAGLNRTDRESIVREAKADAWDEGLNTGIGYKTAMDVLGPAAPEPANPYHAPAEGHES